VRAFPGPQFPHYESYQHDQVGFQVGFELLNQGFPDHNMCISSYKQQATNNNNNRFVALNMHPNDFG